MFASKYVCMYVYVYKYGCVVCMCEFLYKCMYGCTDVVEFVYLFGLFAGMHAHMSMCNYSSHTTTHCNTLQHTATRCNTLQHTATHCD